MSKKDCSNEQRQNKRDEKNLEFASEFCNVKDERRLEKDCDNCKR
ncbi:hypothetical protein [Anaerosporomusa subterranea]|nr:hypothetical protein [Anaerosporomusa subterranea]